MNPRYITLITQRADREDHPRGHLRWLELDENGLKLGFSSRSVLLQGSNLELLLRGLVTGKVEEIQERPERDAEPGNWSVHTIGAPKEDDQSKGDAKPQTTSPKKP